MRIGCLQFAPKLGDVNNNLNRADAVLSKANPENLDLLCLPELAFSVASTNQPFSRASRLWRDCALGENGRTQIQLCYDSRISREFDVKAKWPTGPEYYNSAIVVNGEGETIGNYRKSFLYYTDETWALGRRRRVLARIYSGSWETETPL
ncbi:hypothetical protein GL218_02179 [Daldinia childiae]|uniref:uncharacterized protein n=1 Tax=Daldinia childiae TaxID=326645 RepID=UPI0014483CCA|nr:uncharacterized protein GL218_02179 [Daldinia childiae]KAF3063953.1 hypothetical protein GL218_02179 [Daldinia childiae]